MQKKIHISFFTILALVVCGVFVWLYNFANEYSFKEIEYKLQKKQTTPEKVVEDTWANKMVKTSSQGFHFPVNELFIHLDLRDIAPEKEKSFQLIINRSDRYSQFCIMQTLSSFSLPYSMVKDKQEQSIYVGGDNKKVLEDVVEKLKMYDIESEIKEVWL